MKHCHKVFKIAIMCLSMLVVIDQSLAAGGSQLTINNLRAELTDNNLNDGISPSIIFPLSYGTPETPNPIGSASNIGGNATNPNYFDLPTITYAAVPFGPLSSVSNRPVTFSSVSSDGDPFSANASQIDLQARAFAAPGDDAFAYAALTWSWNGASRLFLLSANTTIKIYGDMRMQAFADPNAFEHLEFGSIQADMSFRSIASDPLQQVSSFSKFLYAGNSPGPEYLDVTAPFLIEYTNSSNVTLAGELYGYFLVSALSNAAPVTPVPELSQVILMLVGLGLIVFVAKLTNQGLRIAH